MNKHNLKTIIDASIVNNILEFDFGKIENTALETAAKNILKDGKLKCANAVVTELTENNLSGWKISGLGLNGIFKQTQLELLLYIESETCLAKIAATGLPDWKFSSMLLLKRMEVFDYFPASALKNVVIKFSFVANSEKLFLVDFVADIVALGLEGELKTWLGLNELKLVGKFGLANDGTKITKLDFNLPIHKSLDLGPFQASQFSAGIAGVFTKSGKEKTPVFMQTLLRLRATLSIHTKTEIIPVPITASMSHWGKKISFHAQTNALSKFALQALDSLGDSIGITALLPENFKLADTISVSSFSFDLNLAQKNILTRVACTFAQANDWDAYTFPSGKKLRLQNTQVNFIVFHEDNQKSIAIRIQGELKIGDAVFIFDCVPSSKYLQVYLQPNTTLPLGQLLDEWLGANAYLLPAPLKQILLSECSGDFSFANGACAFKVAYQNLQGFTWGDTPLVVSGSLQTKYTPSNTKKIELYAATTFDYRGMVFRSYVELVENYKITATAQNLKLSTILEAWTGEALPDGMPNLISDELTLTIASDKSFSIAGDFRVTTEQLNLAGKELVLVGVKFKFAYSSEKIEVVIDVHGNPDWEITSGCKLHTYNLSFTYDKDKTTGTAWKLGGGLDVTLFETRRLQVAGAWESSAEKKKLSLSAGAQALTEKVLPNAFTAIKEIDEAGSTEIFNALKNAGLLDTQGQATPAFTPWKEEFSFKPPEAFSKHTEAILEIVAGQNQFISIAHEGQKLATYTPHALSLIWENANNTSTWSLDAVSSMQFYTPLTGNDPVFKLRYGQVTFKRNEAEKETKFSFKAKEASLKIFELPYSEASDVAQESGEIKTEKKTFTAKFNLGQFSFEKKSDEWTLLCDSDLQFSDMPKVMAHVLEDKIVFGATLKKEGLEFFAKDGLKTLTIPDFLKDLGTAAGITLPDVGNSAIKLTGLFLKIGKELSIRAEAGLGLPEKLNEALGFQKKIIRTFIPNNDQSLIRASISFGTDGIKGNVLSSPFEDIEGISEQDHVYTIDLDKLTGVAGCGMLKLKKPELSLDFKKGAFKLNGGYEIVKEKGLAVPLGPLKAFMKLVQLPEIAKALPPKVSITELDFTPEAFKKLLDDSGLEIPKEFTDAIETVSDYFKKLPPRLQDFFKVRLPDKVDFALQVTPDGGVSFNLETTGAPIQFLLPTPVALMGYQLSRIDFGTAFGGSLLKLELSARIDSFDYISIASALFLYDNTEVAKWMPPPELLGRSFEIKDLVVLIVYQSGIPIPIPVFYKTLAVKSVGPEGLVIDAGISFPKPEINLMKALKIIGELKNLFTKGDDLTVVRPITFELGENYKDGEAGESELNLIFNAGPLYIRLPKWIATETDPKGGLRGQTLGITGKYQLLNVLNFTGILFNSMHHLFKKESDSSYFLKSFAIKHRMGVSKADLFGFLQTEAAWIAATPKEFVSDGWKLLANGLGETQAKELLKVIPVDDQFLLNDSDDKSSLIFLHGKLQITKAFEASATSGLLFSSSRAGVGLRLAGQIGNNTFTWLLQGAARIDKSGAFMLRGKADFAFLKINLFQGDYLLTNDRLKVTMALGDANLPVRISGELNGEFRTGVFKLDGSGSLRFFGLETSVSHRYHFDETSSLIEHKGKLKLGALANFDLELIGKTATQQFELGAHLNGEVLSVVSFDFLGQLSENAQTGLEVKGKMSISLLQKEVLGVSAVWNKNGLSFEQSMNLFPGLESVMIMKNQIIGYIGHDRFELEGAGQFKLGPLDLSTHLHWRWENEVYKFQTTLKQFLGVNATLDLSGENGELVMNGKLDGAVKLFNDVLQISSTSNPAEGPALQLSVKEHALQRFYVDGKFTLLGIATAAQLKWENSKLDLAIWHRLEAGSLFKADYQLLANYTPESLTVQSSFDLELDLKPVFDVIGKGNAKNTKTTFSIKHLKLEVSQKNPSGRKEDPVLLQLQKDIEAELTRIKIILKNQEKETELIIKELEAYRAYASKKQTGYNYNIPEQRDRWNFWEDKFQAANTLRNDIASKQKDYTEHVNHHADLIRAVGDAAKNVSNRVKTRDDFNAYFEHMWYASKCWKHPHEGDGRSWQEFRRVYREDLEPYMRRILTGLGAEYIVRFIGKPPHDNTHTLADFYSHEIYWGWHSPGNWREHQRNAVEAKKTTWGTLNQFVEEALEHENKTKGYRDHAANVCTIKNSEREALIRQGEGFLLVSQLDEKNHVETDLLAYDIKNNGMEKKSSQDQTDFDMADSDSQWNVAFEATITFQLLGIEKEFTLANIKWQSAEGIDLSRPLPEWLAKLLLDFLEKNFFQILGQNLNNIIEIIDYVVKQLMGKRSGDYRDPRLGLLESLAELDGRSESIDAYLKGK
jgi:hypothetical protein